MATLILIAAAAAWLAGGEPGVCGQPERPPNVLFILIDDMGWPDLACYGHAFHETPQIDRLCAQGMKFTDFYAGAPVCSPTRAMIQSGQYSARVGITTIMFHETPQTYRLCAQGMKSVDFYAGTPVCSWTRAMTQSGQYSATVGITDFISGQQGPFHKLVSPPSKRELPASIRTPGDALAAAGYVTGYFGKWHLGCDPHDRGYQVVDGNLGEDFQAWRKTSNRGRGPKQIDLLTDQTLWFIRQHRDRPFFVTLSHYAVHSPVGGSPGIEKYRNKPKPAEGVNNPAYAALIENLDRSVGRILALLDELRLTDRTLVVFTSDNGGFLSTGAGEVISTNAPLRDGKGTLYEGGIRVPMIVRWPGVVKPGSVCREPTMTADLLPTFCEAAGAKLPEQPIDGTSLVPLLANPDAKLAREAIYFHYPHYHHSRPAGAIRAGDWKLIEFFDGAPLELYHLKDDLGETTNLAERMPEKAEKLRKMLAGWRQSVGALMPTPNRKYDPARAQEW